jgi:hypothetical protein
MQIGTGNEEPHNRESEFPDPEEGAGSPAVNYFTMRQVLEGPNTITSADQPLRSRVIRFSFVPFRLIEGNGTISSANREHGPMNAPRGTFVHQCWEFRQKCVLESPRRLSDAKVRLRHTKGGSGALHQF